MGGPARNRERDAAAINAAAERLLAGTPLRSVTGRLTATELIVESGLRRDVVYPEHQNLVDEFRLKAKARNHVPTATQELAAKHEAAAAELARTKELLAIERQGTAYLRRVAVELSIELENARLELRQQSADVVPLRRPVRPNGPPVSPSWPGA